VVSGPTKPRAVLIGPPGSGKSTIGRRLAKELGASWHDTDEAIAAAAGTSISDIFVDHGEAQFRDLERAEVAASLSRDGVVSLGGGAPMDPATQAALAGHTVVFLDVGIADAARRVGFDASRPLLMGERRATYERLATHRVDTAGRKPAAVVAEIVELLEGQP
jgi:shikimate kinase